MPYPPSLAPVTLSGSFTNWHGTVTADVTHWVQPQTVRQLRDLLGYCVANGQRVSVCGSRWSLSRIGQPEHVLVDVDQLASGLPAIRQLPASMRATPPEGSHEYFVVSGTTSIEVINDRLARHTPPYALQASGAANGQRIAGVISTGTHGAAARFGAVHDAVKAICLITGPDTAVLVQPSAQAVTPELAQQLGADMQMTVTPLASDDAFGAALVGLGAVGYVHAVVIEVEPLFQLQGEWYDRNGDDHGVLQAIQSDTPESLATFDATRPPFHLAIAFNPYAKSNTVGSWGTFLWKVPPVEAYTGPRLAYPRFQNEILWWVANNTDCLNHVAPAFVPKVVAAKYHGPFVDPKTPDFPGNAFGRTTLIEGLGRGVEFAVHREDAGRAHAELMVAMRQEAKNHGHYLPGGMGVRWVGRSRHALLGMNAAPPQSTTKGSVHFEIGALADAKDASVDAIYAACCKAMRDSNLRFTMHWGLENGDLRRADLDRYYGDNVQTWIEGRKKLLTTDAARKVFRNPLTDRLGLTSG